MALAEEMLTDAWALFSDMSYRSAADRAYYAMFHAAQAVLAHLKVELPRSHRGVRALFGKHVILPGLLSRDYSRDLSVAQQIRQEMTYDVLNSPARDEVQELLAKARRFIDATSELVKGPGR